MQSSYRALRLFVLATVLLGISFVATKAGLAFFPPIIFTAIRFDVAAVLLLGYVAFTTDGWQPRTRQDIAGVLISGALIIGAANILLFVGQQFTTSAIASIIYSLLPILTAVFALGLLPKERLSRSGLLGVFLGIIGVIIIARPDPTNLLTTGLIGKGVILLSAGVLALGSVLLRRTSPTISNEALTGWGLLVGAIISHGASVLYGESVQGIQWTPEALVALGYLSIFASAIVFTVYFELIDQIGPTKANLLDFSIPVVTTIVGWLWLGEAITVATVVGFVVIFTGFTLLEYRALAETFSRLRASIFTG